MDSYLMMLYVTLEQESALKTFFVDQGWTFSKPDLSVTTDKLGPVVPNAPEIKVDTDAADMDIPVWPIHTFPKIKINLSGSETAVEKRFPLRKSKRKSRSTKTTASVKQARKVPNASDQELSELTENLESEEVENTENETTCKNTIKSPVTVQVNDGNKVMIKLEQEKHDADFKLELDETSDVLNDGDFDDDGDDDIDEGTDLDYSFDVASTSEGNAELKTESQPNGNDPLATNIAAGRGKGQGTGRGAGRGTKGKKKKIPVIVKCEVCFKQFASKGNLRKHMQRHGEKQFACRMCDKCFFRADELKQHIFLVHEDSETPVHICDVCGNIYKSRSALHSHYSYKHATETKADTKCTICGKVLSCKRKRLQHEQRHREGFKFSKCEKCSRFYKNEKDHMKTCIGIENFERHKCEECGSSFVEAKYLAKHMKKKHRQIAFQCTACDMTFSDRKAALGHAGSCFSAMPMTAFDEI